MERRSLWSRQHNSRTHKTHKRKNRNKPKRTKVFEGYMGHRLQNRKN